MSKTKKLLPIYRHSTLLSIATLALISTSTYSSADIPAEAQLKSPLNLVSLKTSKPVNAPHTQSVLLTTRGNTKFDELDTQSNPTAPWVKYVEAVDSESASNKPHNKFNKAGNNLFSVNEYDVMLRRIVEKTSNSNASLDIWEDIRSGFRLKGYDQIRVDTELDWLKKQQKYWLFSNL